MTGGSMEILETRITKYFDEVGLISIDPGDRRQTTDGTRSVCGVNQGHGNDARQQTLEQVKDILDGTAYPPDRLEGVAVENHFPLYATLGRKEG